MKQLRPSPASDPGFRLDLHGKALFRHKGMLVDVHVRHATTEDTSYFYSDGTNPDDVVLTATVTIENAELARVTHGADISDAFGMRDTLTQALDDAVADARRTVARLVAHLAKVDTELAKTSTA